jgi:hypothetical protein
MSKVPKVKEFLRQALEKVGTAITAYQVGGEEEVSKAVWLAALDVEYAAFLLSLSRGERQNDWKEAAKPSMSVNVETCLQAARDLLKGVLLIADLDEIYRKTWLARDQMLIVQRELNRASSRVRGFRSS